MADIQVHENIEKTQGDDGRAQADYDAFRLPEEDNLEATNSTIELKKHQQPKNLKKGMFDELKNQEYSAVVKSVLGNVCDYGMKAVVYSVSATVSNPKRALQYTLAGSATYSSAETLMTWGENISVSHMVYDACIGGLLGFSAHVLQHKFESKNSKSQEDKSSSAALIPEAQQFSLKKTV